jgi:hypothetical protein
MYVYMCVYVCVCSGASHSAMLVNLTQSHQATVDELNRGYSDAKKLLAEKCEEYRFLEVVFHTHVFLRVSHETIAR